MEVKPAFAHVYWIMSMFSRHFHEISMKKPGIHWKMRQVHRSSTAGNKYIKQWIGFKYCFLGDDLAYFLQFSNCMYSNGNLLYLVDVQIVSLTPSDTPLTIREGTTREVRCVVNSNALPVPTINWYLGSTNITYITGADATSFNLTGNRTDNTKTLQCKASNNNKPPKAAITTLNVECKCLLTLFWDKHKLK